jgi:hypothetical protein
MKTAAKMYFLPSYRTGKFIVGVAILLIFCGSVKAQSSFSISGGFNQSVFYTQLPRTEYYHRIRSYDAYLINFAYKEDFSSLRKNLRLGTQLEFKQQSAWFYYEDNFPKDTFATGVRYDIRSLNLYLFPELRVGENVKFVFGGGPVFQYVMNTKAEGTQIQSKTDEASIETKINDKNSKDITGFSFGVKINLGVEIPLCKNLYLLFNNSYTFGLTGFRGNLRKQMKFFNSIDLSLSGGLLWQINHREWFSKRVR